MKPLKFRKIGRGRYSTTVNGITVQIEKQYSRNNWTAYSEFGEIDIDRETLWSVKSALNSINN